MVLTLPLLERCFPQVTLECSATSCYKECSNGAAEGSVINGVWKTVDEQDGMDPTVTHSEGVPVPLVPRRVAPGMPTTGTRLGTWPVLPFRDGCLQGPVAAPPSPCPCGPAPWGNPWMAAPSWQPRLPGRVGSYSQEPAALGTIMGSPRETPTEHIFHGEEVQSIGSKHKS